MKIGGGRFNGKWSLGKGSPHSGVHLTWKLEGVGLTESGLEGGVVLVQGFI